MSALQRPRQTIHWLTLVALAALAYSGALAVIALLGTAATGRSLADWVGRSGSVVVIAGVLLDQRSGASSIPDAACAPSATTRERTKRLGPWCIGCGLTAIVTGFALGVLGL